MNNTRTFPCYTVISGLVLLLASSCSFPSSKPMVSASQVGVLRTLELGSVVAVRDVVLEGQKTNLGMAGGAAIGGAAAYPGGSVGTGDVVVQAVALVAGAVAGQAIEEAATRENAQELTIRMDNGRTVLITVEVPDGRFREGDRVQVGSGGGYGESTVRLAAN